MEKIKKFFSSIDWANISPVVIARYVLGIISILNIILDKLGVMPVSVSENTVYTVCSMVFAAIMIIVNTYKNNSTSVEAMIADNVMRVLKASGDINTQQPILNQINDVLVKVQADIADEEAVDNPVNKITNE